jgi:ribosomal-protein-alanine N-acetyltransferase
VAHVRVPGPFTTDRLILRPSEVDDAETFHQLWTERDPRVPPHRRIDTDGRPTVEDIAAGLARADPATSAVRLLTVEVAESGDVIGYCGLTVRGHGSPDEPELAYELVRAAHGCGYATEAGAAVVARARKAGYPRLWAGVWDWNTASRRVLSKLGFREVGRVEPSSAHGHSLLAVLEL